METWTPPDPGVHSHTTGFVEMPFNAEDGSLEETLTLNPLSTGNLPQFVVSLACMVVAKGALSGCKDPLGIFRLRVSKEDSLVDWADGGRFRLLASSAGWSWWQDNDDDDDDDGGDDDEGSLRMPKWMSILEKAPVIHLSRCDMIYTLSSSSSSSSLCSLRINSLSSRSGFRIHSLSPSSNFSTFNPDDFLQHDILCTLAIFVGSYVWIKFFDILVKKNFIEQVCLSFMSEWSFSHKVLSNILEHFFVPLCNICSRYVFGSSMDYPFICFIIYHCSLTLTLIWFAMGL